METEVIVYQSHLTREEIYIVCKFPYARTCMKEQCQWQEELLFFAGCWFDRQNDKFDQKYTEEGLWADLIFVNCISELRLPIVRAVSLLFLGLVTPSYFGTMAKVRQGSDILKPFSGEGNVMAWLKKVRLVARLQQVDDVSELAATVPGGGCSSSLNANEGGGPKGHQSDRGPA